MHRLFLLSLLIGCGDPKEGDDTGWDDEALICIDTPDALNLAWPIEGLDAQQWVISNYVDLDSGTDMEDYMSNTGEQAKTYDGHQGIDISISSFRQMDEGIPVLAAVSGTVEYVIDGYEDRHTSCTDYDANIVGVRHESGHLLHYVHLRTDSSTVQVGDWVEAGDILGEVGSSGCSDGPHLHFEITDPDGSPVEPFLEDMWCDPPLYDTPLGVMESWILDGPLVQYDNPMQDPPEDATDFDVGDTLLAFVVVGGGLPDDELGVQLSGPDGTTIGPWPVIFEQSYQLSFWYWAYTVESPAGDWTADYLVNGDIVTQHDFTVR